MAISVCVQSGLLVTTAAAALTTASQAKYRPTAFAFRVSFILHTTWLADRDRDASLLVDQADSSRQQAGVLKWCSLLAVAAHVEALVPCILFHHGACGFCGITSRLTRRHIYAHQPATYLIKLSSREESCRVQGGRFWGCRVSCAEMTSRVSFPSLLHAA